MRTGDRMPVELRRALQDVFRRPVDDVELREHSWFAKLHGRASATTRFNTIYLRGSAEEFFSRPDLMLHEYYHVLQQWNRGRLTVLSYLLEWQRRGYWNSRYERHARRFARTRLAAFRAAMARAGRLV
jgi:hypothetical protein